MENQTLQIKKKTYIINPELQQFVDNYVKNKKPYLINMINNITIQYVLIYPYISKNTVAKCIRSNDLIRLFGECEYVIEFSGELWDKLDEELKEIIVWHELLHILVTTDNNGDFQYKIKDHDVKDFYEIIQQYGVDWFSKLKTICSSVYDLTPEETDNISL